MIPQTYKTPLAFRRALEDRLKDQSRKEGTDLQRLRRSVGFERFLCRLFASPNAPWLLKGGYAMELRISSARATKDNDLTLPTHALTRSKNGLLEMLQEAAEGPLTNNDFFAFIVGAPTMNLQGAPYGGSRFPVTASIGGKPFVKFHLDLGVGDVADEPFEKFIGHDWLSFAGITPGQYLGLSKEAQFSEKLHAYTRPLETGVNSRVKDLIDLLILMRLGLSLETLRRALIKIFKKRDSHLLPLKLEAPPEFWATPYAELAKECQLSESISNGFAELSSFYDENQLYAGL